MFDLRFYPMSMYAMRERRNARKSMPALMNGMKISIVLTVLAN